jgi:hypothetical protein
VEGGYDAAEAARNDKENAAKAAALELKAGVADMVDSGEITEVVEYYAALPEGQLALLHRMSPLLSKSSAAAVAEFETAVVEGGTSSVMLVLREVHGL